MRSQLSIDALGHQLGWYLLDAGDELLDEQVRSIDVQSEPLGSHLPSSRIAPNQLSAVFTFARRKTVETQVWLDHLHASQPLVASCCSCQQALCMHAAALVSYYLRGRHEPAEVHTAPVAASPPAELGYEETEWLRELEEAAAASAPAKALEAPYRLVYLLRQVEGTADAYVAPLIARKLKGERTLECSAFGHALDDELPAYVSPADRYVLRRLRGLAENYEYARLHDADGWLTLGALLRSGRLFASEPIEAGHALQLGPTRGATIEWQLDAQDGSQRLVARCTPPADVVLLTQPLAYVDRSTGQAGALSLPIGDALARVLLDYVPVPPEQAEALGRNWDPQRFGVAAPRPIPRETRRMEPQARLHLHKQPASAPFAPARYAADITFDYGGTALSPEAADDALHLFQQGKLLHIPRQRAREQQLLIELQQVTALAPDHTGPGFVYRQIAFDYQLSEHNRRLEAERWSALAGPLSEQLRQRGWQVSLDESFDLRAIEVDAWSGNLHAEGEEGWFDLELGIRVGTRTLSMVPILLNLLARPDLADRHAIEALPEPGASVCHSEVGLLRLDNARLKPLLLMLHELYQRQAPLREHKLRLSRFDLLTLAAGADAGWSGGEALRKLAERLRDFSGIETVALPAGFGATLRDYQQTGLNWLQFLQRYELGGILGDDMGLGKTVQALAHLHTEKSQGRLRQPALVVATTSLMSKWPADAARFAPSLRVVVFHGSGRNRADLDGADLIVTTYSLLVREQAALTQRRYHLVIFDEAQHVKNAQTAASLAARELQANCRIAMTGTALENRLLELWSIMNHALPGLLGGLTQFKQAYVQPIENEASTSAQARLRRRIRPFLLRRTKRQVAKDLPALTETVRYVELEPLQRDLYESIRVAQLQSVRELIAARGFARSKLMVLTALLKLRQLCCDVRLLKEAPPAAQGAAKLTELMSMLEQLLSAGARVLVFSQFAEMLALIEPALHQANIAYAKLVGATSNRAQAIASFQSGKVPVFLISLKAGGEGLDLTAADSVVVFDPWWNPAAESQASGRAHRIGQSKPVFVYRLIAKDTVEEKILDLQDKKRELARSILDSEHASMEATRAEDILALLDGS